MRFPAGERMTAEEVLGCEWMKRWAFPDFEEMKRCQGAEREFI